MRVRACVRVRVRVACARACAFLLLIYFFLFFSSVDLRTDAQTLAQIADRHQTVVSNEEVRKKNKINLFAISYVFASFKYGTCDN